MRIYLICPVRLSTPDTIRTSDEYVKGLEREGHTVFYPHRDIDQVNSTIDRIVEAELQAIREADEVHIFWDKNSRGSHFDLGAALVLDKPVKLVHAFLPDDPFRTYEKIIRSRQQKSDPPRRTEV